MLYNANNDLILNDGLNPSYTDAECIAAFVNEMNKKAAYFGMTDVTFVDPHGLNNQTVMSPKSMLMMGFAACSHRRLCNIWDMRGGTYDIGNIIDSTKIRQLEKTDAVYTERIGYQFLGGKGGSLDFGGSALYKNFVHLYVVEGSPVLIAIMGKGTWAWYNGDYTVDPVIPANMFLCITEICDRVKASIKGETVPTENPDVLGRLITDGGGYCAVPLPLDVPTFVNRVDPDYLLTLPHAIHNNANANDLYPASTTKIMTTICALDHVSNYDQPLVVKLPADKPPTGSSGSTYYNGDVINFNDAMRIMMRESSNLLANSIARVVGRAILTGKIEESMA